MPRLRIKGRANYDGIVGKSFDVVVEVSDTVGSSKKIGRTGNFPWIAPAPLTKYLSTTFRI